MKKKILSQTLILLSLISMLILPHQVIYADNTKLFPELYFDLQAMSEEESTYVDVYFYITLDIEEMQERTKDADTYEERYEIISSMYDEIIAEFIHKYYENDMDKVMKIDYDWLAVAVQATKGQILQFTEEETVLYIESTQEINGYEGRESIGLLEVKVAAIANVTGYVDISDYRMEQQKEIRTIINETLDDINGANYEKDIEVIVSDAEKRMDAVKTDEQLKKEEWTEITPTEEPTPTVSPSDPGTNPTITPSQTEPTPTVEPSEFGQKPMVTPSQTEAKPTVVPPKTESKPDKDLNVTPQEKESITVPTTTPEAMPAETDTSPTITPKDEKITTVPTVTPEEKVSLLNDSSDSEQAESEKSQSNTILPTIALIALTAIILTIIWFTTKKRRHP